MISYYCCYDHHIRTESEKEEVYFRKSSEQVNLFQTVDHLNIQFGCSAAAKSELLLLQHGNSPAVRPAGCSAGW